MTKKTAHRQTSKQIRGSGLLLSGRFLAIAINLLTQVLIVRHFSKMDYGVFAYTLALVNTASTLNRLGMERAVARFTPIYEEKEEFASAAGAVVLALGTMTALGFAIVTLVIGFNSLLTDTFIENPAVINILVVLIVLAPVDAFDELLQALFAAFGKARVLFLRQHIIGPCLKLATIALTIAISGDIHTLAIATVFASVAGIFLYGVLLPNVLRERNLIQYFRPGMFSIEYRRLFRFAMPVFTADMASALRLVLVFAILEYFHSLSNVADYRAVMPIARLNSVVLMSFSILFLPMAARLFAQKNTALLGEMQSHVALWVTVLSFPVFAACISLAEPLIVLLLGERYASAAPILAILAVGYFFQAALGLNRQTLRALGKVRVLLYIEIIATIIVLIATWLLAPRFGAIGGAIATTATMILYSSMNTIALWRFTGNNPMPWLYAKVYLLAAACALGLWLVKPLMGIDSILISILLAGFTSIIVILSCWKLLHFAEIFPEAIRFLKSMRR
jgi:O-antigen/teichoic acid export membrane protein